GDTLGIQLPAERVVGAHGCDDVEPAGVCDTEPEVDQGGPDIEPDVVSVAAARYLNELFLVGVVIVAADDAAGKLLEIEVTGDRILGAINRRYAGREVILRSAAAIGSLGSCVDGQRGGERHYERQRSHANGKRAYHAIPLEYG